MNPFHLVPYRLPPMSTEANPSPDSGRPVAGLVPRSIDAASSQVACRQVRCSLPAEVSTVAASAKGTLFGATPTAIEAKSNSPRSPRAIAKNTPAIVSMLSPLCGITPDCMVLAPSAGRKSAAASRYLQEPDTCFKL